MRRIFAFCVRLVVVGLVAAGSVGTVAARDFYADPCAKTLPLVDVDGVDAADYHVSEGGVNTFVIKLPEVNIPAIAGGNFYTMPECERSDYAGITQVDGLLFPYNRAVVTCHKDVLKALSAGAVKYVVDGRAVSKKEFYAIPAYMYKCAKIADDVVTMELRRQKEEENGRVSRLYDTELKQYKIAHPVSL